MSKESDIWKAGASFNFASETPINIVSVNETDTAPYVFHCECQKCGSHVRRIDVDTMCVQCLDCGDVEEGIKK